LHRPTLAIKLKSEYGEKRMKKVFVLLATVFALNSMFAYAEDVEISEAPTQSELPEGVAPLPEYVAAD
jgi:hypothetical protein